MNPTIRNIRLTSISIFVALAGTLFTSCAAGPAAIRPLVAAGTAATIQYVIPKDKKVEVATNTVAAGNLYQTYSDGHIPTPAQLKLALDTYLPNNPSKVLTETGIVSLYSAYYPRFKDKIPQEKLDYFTNFLLGAKDGATPFLSGP